MPVGENNNKRGELARSVRNKPLMNRAWMGIQMIFTLDTQTRMKVNATFFAIQSLNIATSRR